MWNFRGAAISTLVIFIANSIQIMDEDREIFATKTTKFHQNSIQIFKHLSDLTTVLELLRIYSHRLTRLMEERWSNFKLF